MPNFRFPLSPFFLLLGAQARGPWDPLPLKCAVFGSEDSLLWAPLGAQSWGSRAVGLRTWTQPVCRILSSSVGDKNWLDLAPDEQIPCWAVQLTHNHCCPRREAPLLSSISPRSHFIIKSARGSWRR